MGGKPGGYRNWSAQDKRLLAELDGRPLAEVAKTLGRSVSSVTMMRWRTGLAVKTDRFDDFEEDEVEVARRLVAAEGRTVREVATALGTTDYQVKKLLRRLGLRPAGRLGKNLANTNGGRS